MFLTCKQQLSTYCLSLCDFVKLEKSVEAHNKLILEEKSKGKKKSSQTTWQNDMRKQRLPNSIHKMCKKMNMHIDKD